MGIFRDRDAQKLRRIKQRKGVCFIRALNDDDDDKDDEYDSKVFPDRNAQNLHRIKQRKERCFIQASSDDQDDQDDDLITPYTFQISVPKMRSPQRNTPVEACVPICAIL